MKIWGGEEGEERENVRELMRFPQKNNKTINKSQSKDQIEKAEGVLYQIKETTTKERKNSFEQKRKYSKRKNTEKNQMWQKTKMNQNTAGRVVVEGAQSTNERQKRGKNTKEENTPNKKEQSK